MLEETFLHIPKNAISGSSIKMKVFWITWTSLFSVYVFYTSVDIVRSYVTQPVVVNVEHERFVGIPDILVEVLPAFSGSKCNQKVTGNDTGFAVFRETFFNPLEGHHNCERSQQPVEIMSGLYNKFISSLLGTVWIHRASVDAHSDNMFNSPLAFEEQASRPVFWSIVSANNSPWNDYFTDVSIVFIMNCSWINYAKKFGESAHFISLSIVGDDFRHNVKYAGSSFRPKPYPTVNLRTTRFISQKNCETTTYFKVQYLKVCVCIVKKVLQH